MNYRFYNARILTMETDRLITGELCVQDGKILYHAYCAHAQLMQQLNLRRRLERRPCQLGIDTLKQLDIVFFCRASDDLLQLWKQNGVCGDNDA